MGIQKKYRLKSDKRIATLFSEGKRIFHYPVQCLYLPSAENHHRIGFIVGKRKLKSAVQRNTIKRRMREQFRTQIKGYYTEETYDILLLYQATKMLPSATIGEGIENLISSLQL